MGDAIFTVTAWLLSGILGSVLQAIEFRKDTGHSLLESFGDFLMLSCMALLGPANLIWAVIVTGIGVVDRLFPRGAE